MSKEKMKILEMVEQKIITVEEGMKMLEAIEKADNTKEVKENVILSEEEKEEMIEELEDFAEEVEDELDEIVEEMESKIEDLEDEVEAPSDEAYDRADEIREKAERIKEKVNENFNRERVDEFFNKEFKDNMKDFKKSIKIDMDGFAKEARKFGKEMAAFGAEMANMSKDVIKSVQKDFEGESTYNLAQEFNLDCTGKEEIEVIVVSTDVTVVTEEREDLLVNYIKYSKKDDDRFKIEVTEDSKKISVVERHIGGKSLFNFGFTSKKLLIKLPRKYKESFKIKTVSGDADVNYLDSDTFTFSSVSGDLKADIIYSVNSLVKTTSGCAEVDLFRGNMMFSTVSGDIKMKYEKLDGDFTLKSVSGDAKVSIPTNSVFEANLKTVSGDLKCDFPLTMIGPQKRNKMRGQYNGDDYKLSAKTTSGDLRIYQF